MEIPDIPQMPYLWIKFKPVQYFEHSDFWDALVENNEFQYLDVDSDKYPEEDEYLAPGMICYEISAQKEIKINYIDGEYGVYEIHQDGRWYLDVIHPDMIETIYTKEEYPEYYL